jgi:protocatechuate 3,4-dioxygenase beta subunit
MQDHDDDRPVGHVLSRRDMVRLLGAGGAASLLPFGAIAASHERASALQTQASAARCVVKPEMTEGPYFVDHQLERADIRIEPTTGAAKPGEVLRLALSVVDATRGQCRPLPGAIVDVWQCDASGVYSGVTDPMQGFETVNQKFLRGFQTTNAEGLASFTTIYPGWYPGRTVHIHFKIRTQAAGSAYEFTSQWYFDEALNDRVLSSAAYKRPGRRDTTNSSDMPFRNGGDQLLLTPTAGTNGLTATFALGLDLSDASVGRRDGFGPGGRGRGRGPGRGPGGGRLGA